MSLKRLIGINRALCDHIETRLPQAQSNMFSAYIETVVKYMNEPGRPKQVIVDIGGGKNCPFAALRDSGRTKIIAVDISAEEMAENQDVDECRVADVTESLPFAADEVDMIVSRSALEHFVDLEKVITNCKKALRGGGYFINLFPCRYAPFSIINQLLPNAAARTLLHHLRPAEQRGHLGFPAHYDKCYWDAFIRLLRRQGFEIREATVSYYQSRYFDFFFPLFLISSLYEIILHRFKLQNFGAYLLIVAQLEQK